MTHSIHSTDQLDPGDEASAVIGQLAIELLRNDHTMFDETVNIALKTVGGYARADRSYLFMLRDDDITIDYTHEWCAPGVEPQIANIGSLPLSNFPTFEESLRDRREVHIPRVDALPPGSLREILEPQGIQSLLVVPLYSRERLRGFIGFDAVNTTRAWSDKDRTLLRLTTDLIAHSLDRHAAEQDLKESHERFLLLLDSLEAMVYIVDFDSYEVLYINEYGRSQFGEIEGNLCWKSLQGGQTGPCSFCTNPHLRDEKGAATGPHVWEFRNTANHRWYHIIYRAIPWIGGRLVRMEIATDITELKDAEELAAVTLNSIGDAVITTDKDGLIKEINHVAESLLGFTAAEARGRAFGSIVRLVHDKSRAPVPDPVQSCLSRGEAVELPDDCLLLDRHDEVHPVADSTAPIRARNGDIVGAVMIMRDVTDTRRMTRQLRHQAAHDALTGLVNRTEFMHLLEKSCEKARQQPVVHALLYLDLDQFKVVNDTCGHAAGDALLQQLVPLIGQALRRSDVFGRLGGDEFGVLLRQCPTERAIEIAEKIRVIVSNYRFSWQKNTFAVGVSIGVVPIGTGNTDAQVLMSNADSACYAAKEHGRNRVHLYSPESEELNRRQGEMQWVSRLQSALEEGRLRLYRQNIVSPLGDDPVGSSFEILLRIIDREGRVILPGAFLPAAERYNMSSRIDHWVIENTFEWFCQNPDQVEQLRLCAINLSGHSLADNNLGRFIADCIESSGVEAHKICFEITETAAVANMVAAVNFISQLKALGCLFALDDFGSGMSSFGYLKNLPVDFLKIEGMFVRDIMDNDTSFSLVKSINEIAHVMGKQTIAEFVENDDILDKLKTIRVDHVQGFGVSMPEPLPGTS